jgi:hypothetical protein
MGQAVGQAAAGALGEPCAEGDSNGRTQTEGRRATLPGRKARFCPMIGLVIRSLRGALIEEELVLGVADQAGVDGALLVQANHAEIDEDLMQHQAVWPEGGEAFDIEEAMLLFHEALVAAVIAGEPATHGFVDPAGGAIKPGSFQALPDFGERADDKDAEQVDDRDSRRAPGIPGDLVGKGPGGSGRDAAKRDGQGDDRGPLGRGWL